MKARKRSEVAAAAARFRAAEARAARRVLRESGAGPSEVAEPESIFPPDLDPAFMRDPEFLRLCVEAIQADVRGYLNRCIRRAAGVYRRRKGGAP